jgi:head-tail adaptor
MDEIHQQEKLRYEQELQTLKSAVHQELDEEKQALREERKAFELLVSAQTKNMSHVGNIQDDEESTSDSESVVSQLKLRQKQQDEMLSDMQYKFDKKLEEINARLQSENDYQKQVMELKLSETINELNQIKAKLVVTEREHMIRVETVESISPSSSLEFETARPQVLEVAPKPVEKTTSFVAAEAKPVVQAIKTPLERQSSYLRKLDVSWEDCLGAYEKQASMFV